jgi:hypothetical protein
MFTPVGRDAEITRRLLDRAAIPCVECPSIAAVCDTFEEQGGAALLLTEEALDDPGVAQLATVLERQPAWSDIPVLLFSGNIGTEASARAIRSIEILRNVTLLERPVRVAAVVSTIRAALRSRARQYEVRDLLVELHRARGDAESANRLKDEFLATLSHELRTPLNAILGWTSMLKRGQIDPSRMAEVFDALDRNAQSQAQLIADVLEVSRIITGNLQLQVTAVDVGDAVARASDAVRPAATTKNITLDIQRGPDHLVHGDADRLQQVFWNLLSNAVKFTPPGGTIRVEIARTGAQIAVTVTDTGAGIAPEFVPFVFDRFRQADQTTTRAYGGLGLGLAIVKHLTELHGGTVTAESEGPGRGSRFRVLLPGAERTIVSNSASSAVSEEVPVSLAGCSIMVVDDDASTREVVSAALESANARIHLADSAAQGWASLQQQLPDLIIADLGMPTEDGYSFIRRVRQISPAAELVPAIALSAYADSHSQEAALAAGFTAFLAKPARPQVLVHMAGELLGVVAPEPARSASTMAPTRPA